jgi:hypothetical protein
VLFLAQIKKGNNMNSKYKINDRVVTEEGPGTVIEVNPGWSEYHIRLDDGREQWILEEDLEKE